MVGRNEKQQPGDHQAGTELRAQHPHAALGKKLQEIACKNESQEDEENEDERGQDHEESKLLVGVGTNEVQIKGGLRHDDREQQNYAHHQKDGLVAAAGLLRRAIWTERRHVITSPGSTADWIRETQGLRGIIISRTCETSGEVREMGTGKATAETSAAGSFRRVLSI